MRGLTAAVAALVLVFGAEALRADPPAARAEDFDPARFIGLDLRSVLGILGVPEQVFPVRGQEESQDTVVFYYPDFVYLSLYQNHVWQVRCDRRFARPVLGLTLGMPRDSVSRVLAGQALTASGDSLYLDLDEEKYPVRVRLVFADGALSDVYVYRSDF